MRKDWWKYLCVAIFLYVFTFGLLTPVPVQKILDQTIRNLFYHVPLWFAMVAILTASVIKSVQYLSKANAKADRFAEQAVIVGLVFGVLGFVTGAIWGHNTWGNIGAWLTSEPRTIASMMAMLVYLAYMVLRGSIKEEQKRAKVSAVFNIFAYVLYLMFVFVIPRLAPATLHPGKGGNPAFAAYDTDNLLLTVFYPSCIGFILLAFWITNVRTRMKNVEHQMLEIS